MNKPITITHPYLLEEWDYIKNGDLSPIEVTYGSHKKVWWVCRKCGNSRHKEVRYKVRTKTDKCLKCRSFVELYPNLAVEWDGALNAIDRYKVLPGSDTLAHWKCSVCNRGWETKVNVRVRGHGCPYCTRQKITQETSFMFLFSNTCLLDEWDYIKNTEKPDKIFPGSDKKVWWKCRVCTHSWETSINKRTRKNFPTGCPACNHYVTTGDNNLLQTHPELAKEWDASKNKLEIDKVTYGSSYNAQWKCICGYCWQARVFNRTRGDSCPLCSCGPVSKISQKWLDSLNISSLKREHYIKDLKVYVDGFDPKTNTVYEFLGDYWHGNPEVFPAEEINPTNKKSYGSLYEVTFDRLRLLEKAGYKVIYIWENNWNESL